MAWPSSLFEWGIHGVLAFLLVASLRLWDDLASVEEDRKVKPERVLCRAKSLRGVWIGLGLLCLIQGALIAILKSVPSVMIYLGLMAFLAAFYAFHHFFDRFPLLCSFIPLLKYPAIVAILSFSWSMGMTTKMVYSATLTILCFWAYEILHDRRLRSVQFASQTLYAVLLALLLIGTCLWWEMLFRSRTAAALQVVLVLLAAFLMWQSVSPTPTRENLNYRHYSVFFIGFTWLLNYAMLGP